MRENARQARDWLRQHKWTLGLPLGAGFAMALILPLVAVVVFVASALLGRRIDKRRNVDR